MKNLKLNIQACNEIINLTKDNGGWVHIDSLEAFCVDNGMTDNDFKYCCITLMNLGMLYGADQYINSDSGPEITSNVDLITIFNYPYNL